MSRSRLQVDLIPPTKAPSSRLALLCGGIVSTEDRKREGTAIERKAERGVCLYGTSGPAVDINRKIGNSNQTQTGIRKTGKMPGKV